ncbi:MAG: hypothetical protein D6698_13800 [Gammaproteobacteria bacterium]|nr:MAG: hypothetical protein D6698_13800 [Gammaproteobacteria bacterium]
MIKFVEGWKPRRDPIFSIEEIAITDGEHIRESKYILSSNHMKIHQFRDLIDGNFQELSVHFPPMWVEAFAATDEDAEMALALL